MEVSDLPSYRAERKEEC